MDARVEVQLAKIAGDSAAVHLDVVLDAELVLKVVRQDFGLFALHFRIFFLKFFPLPQNDFKKNVP